MKIELKTNEVKYLEFTIKDYDGNYFNLTNFSATMQIQQYGYTTLSVNQGCTVSNAIDGLIKYLYNGSLPAGEYSAEIELTNTSGQRYVTPSFDIDVIASLPS